MRTSRFQQENYQRSPFGFSKTISLSKGRIEVWGGGVYFQWVFIPLLGSPVSDDKTYDSIEAAVIAAKKQMR